jgi:hypothetical protein
LPIALPAPSSEGRYQVDAIIQRISKAVGFFIVPTPGTESPSSGTGTLVEWQGTKFFVSALHCFFHDMGGTEQVIRSWNATRFGFRDEHGLGRTESLNEAQQRVQPSIGWAIPVSTQGDFLIDNKRDLIAVRIPPALDALAHAEFINLETEAFTKDLVAGTSLIALGAPIASRVHVLGFGETLIPQVEHVRYDPDIDSSGMTNEVYSPSNFYMPYSLTKDGIAPHGFSGAAVFVNKEPAPNGVWSVSPHIAGIIQQFAKRKGFLIARKISAVLDLLNTDRNAT